MHWLMHVLGLDSASGPAYLAWSGAGGDLGELALIGAILGLYHRHTCHINRCWRIGHRMVEGTPYAVCRRHNPSPKPTHEHVIALHREYLEGRAAKAAGRRGASGERIYDRERDGS